MAGDAVDWVLNAAMFCSETRSEKWPGECSSRASDFGAESSRFIRRQSLEDADFAAFG
jgi:hypothetical protein